MRVKLKVTRKHIKTAVRGDPFRCPIAMALMDISFDEPAVSYASVLATMNGRLYQCKTTKRMENFIKNFDWGNKVKPTSFTVDFYYVPNPNR